MQCHSKKFQTRQTKLKAIIIVPYPISVTRTDPVNLSENAILSGLFCAYNPYVAFVFVLIFQTHKNVLPFNIFWSVSLSTSFF